MLRHLLAVAAVIGFSCAPGVAQEDAVGVPGPIVFEEETFDLVWTSHPTETFYKQEYVPAGQTVEAYDQMFMIDVLVDGPMPDVAANSMVQSLTERKATDPVVNFEIIKNEATGEVILDFTLSSDDGQTLIVEWNAYRYAPVDGGLAMFAISRRGYDDDGAADFLMNLKTMRPNAIQALAEMELPEVVVE